MKLNLAIRWKETSVNHHSKSSKATRTRHLLLRRPRASMRIRTRWCTRRKIASWCQWIKKHLAMAVAVQTRSHLRLETSFRQQSHQLRWRSFTPMSRTQEFKPSFKTQLSKLTKIPTLWLTIISLLWQKGTSLRTIQLVHNYQSSQSHNPSQRKTQPASNLATVAALVASSFTVTACALDYCAQTYANAKIAVTVSLTSNERSFST